MQVQFNLRFPQFAAQLVVLQAHIAHQPAAHLRDQLNQVLQELSKLHADLVNEEQRALAEFSFVEQHVRHSLALPALPAVPSDEPTINKLRATIQCLHELSEMVQQRNFDSKPSYWAAASLLIGFNVGTRTLTVNKMHLRAALPDSQLAVRLSGRWTEQAEDLDAYGNMYCVSCCFLAASLTLIDG